MRHVVLRGLRLRAESYLKTQRDEEGNRLEQLLNYNVNARNGPASVHRFRGIDDRSYTDGYQDRYAAGRQSHLGGFGSVDSLHFIADHRHRKLHYPGRLL